MTTGGEGQSQGQGYAVPAATRRHGQGSCEAKIVELQAIVIRFSVFFGSLQVMLNNIMLNMFFLTLLDVFCPT